MQRLNEMPLCGQCDNLVVKNQATDNTLPFHCPGCDILYDWEDFED